MQDITEEINNPINQINNDDDDDDDDDDDEKTVEDRSGLAYYFSREYIDQLLAKKIPLTKEQSTQENKIVEENDNGEAVKTAYSKMKEISRDNVEIINACPQEDDEDDEDEIRPLKRRSRGRNDRTIKKADLYIGQQYGLGCVDVESEPINEAITQSTIIDDAGTGETTANKNSDQDSDDENEIRLLKETFVTTATAAETEDNTDNISNKRKRLNNNAPKSLYKGRLRSASVEQATTSWDSKNFNNFGGMLKEARWNRMYYPCWVSI